MADLALRILVALGAGAMLRMLSLFGLLPSFIAVLILGGIGAALSKGLKTSRFAVVLAASVSYFVAWYLTQPAAPEGPTTNPAAWDLVWNSLEVFAPFLTPVVGSGLMLILENQGSTGDLHEEITEESLLAEAIPQPPPRDPYDLSDLD